MINRLLLGLLLSPTITLGCSNVACAKKGQFAFTARTMDFPFSTGETLGVGLPRDWNETDLNLADGVYQGDAVRWQNNYAFIGQTYFGSDVLLDGVNDQGVYVSFLYCPDLTKYPKFEADKKKRLFGVSNLVNCILGVSPTLIYALKVVGGLKIIPNAIPVGNGLFVEVPVQLVIRDKSGQCAVIQWVGGKMDVISRGAGNVVTGPPQHHDHIRNAKRYNNCSSQTGPHQVHKFFVEGSGVKLPGDWTSRSRFVRATQLLRLAPRPTNFADARQLVAALLASVQVPLGVGASPTLWKSFIDMHNFLYAFKSVYKAKSHFASVNDGLTAADPLEAYTSYDIKFIGSRSKIPPGVRHVRIKPTPQSDIKEIKNLVELRTPGPPPKIDT